MDQNLKPQKSFPLRMSSDLHNQFNDISKNTLVSKSKLARHALTYFINDVNARGITEVINDINRRTIL
jgi:predicted DNA-binding protein